MSIDRSQRLWFDKVAHQYQEARPAYPQALIEEVLQYSGSTAGSRTLEVGCGPGNATLPFARCGCAMTCLEPGSSLADLAREACKAYPNVNVLTCTFEDWTVEPGAFDLVFSAEAFHWIPPEIAYPKAGVALKPGGTLALTWILQGDPGAGLQAAIDAVYRQQSPPLENPDKALDVQWAERQIRDNYHCAGCFTPVAVTRHAWTVSYTVEQYLQLFETFSAHAALEPQARLALFSALRGEISRFGEPILRRNEAILFQAKKIPS